MSKKKDLQEQLEAIQEQLKSLSHQLKEIKEILTLESQTLRLEEEIEKRLERKHSTRSFYVGVLLGTVLGVIGNFFVSLCN